MRKLKTLKINDINHLSKLIKTPQQKLLQISGAISVNEDDFFYSNKIQKKSGIGEREINPPIHELKVIQRNINQLLQRLLIHDIIKGGVKSRSHIDHANKHIKKKIVITMDISDFFPSVKSERVYNIFYKRLGCCPKIANILTRLTIYHDCLPQGSPTSGIIAVLATEKLSLRFLDLAEKNNATFSIYMDDIAFSANYNLSESFINKANTIIEDERYKINESKTEIMLTTETEQIITGIKVNDGLDIPFKSYSILCNEINSINTQITTKQHRSIIGKLNYWTQCKIKSSKVIHLKRRYLKIYNHQINNNSQNA